MATAGSGKTKTLAVKAATLLSQGLAVAAVTFTKEAALELRNRIIAYAGVHCKGRLLVGTFHGMCMQLAFPKQARGGFGNQILQTVKSDFERPWVLVNEGVRRSYILRALKETELKCSLKDATSIIEQSKDIVHRINLSEEQLEMAGIYQNLMDDANVIDFSDIILKTNKGLKGKNISIMGTDVLLVDEFQDTDAAQFEFCSHHGHGGIPITAVGDDDQAIYSFRRGLGFEGMEKFVNEFRAHRIFLGDNYRCREEILRSAEILISKNTERIPKSLKANKGTGGTISFENFSSKVAEANAVAEEAFMAMLDAADVMLQTTDQEAIASIEKSFFAVISRTNAELIEIQRALIERDIPFRRTKDNDSIFDRQEIQVYAALLRTIVDPKPNDVDQVLAWAGVSMADCKAIRKMFGNNILIGSKADFATGDISTEAVEIWMEFAKKHAQWQSLNRKQLYRLLNAGVFSWLSENLVKPNSIEVLLVAQEMFDFHEGTLAERLERLANSEKKLSKEIEDGFAVSIMTGHGAKGLEFTRVWIIGLNEGVFPSDKSALEEERRLMFVAITRAKELLYVSSVSDKKPSIFLEESGIRIPKIKIPI